VLTYIIITALQRWVAQRRERIGDRIDTILYQAILHPRLLYIIICNPPRSLSLNLQVHNKILLYLILYNTIIILNIVIIMFLIARAGIDFT